MFGDSSVRAFVVDDQEVFRRTARSLIAATEGFELVGEGATGEEALEQAAALQPDLVLVDVRMPGMDGIETARRLRAVTPEAVLILVSVEPMPEQSATLESARAAAYVRKQDLNTAALQRLWRAFGARDG